MKEEGGNPNPEFRNPRREGRAEGGAEGRVRPPGPGGAEAQAAGSVSPPDPGGGARARTRRHPPARPSLDCSMEKRGPVLHIVVVGFHHKKGCQVRGRGCPSSPTSPLRSCASSRPSPGPRARWRLPGCGSRRGRGVSGGAGGLRSVQGVVKDGLGAGEAPLARGLPRPGVTGCVTRLAPGSSWSWSCLHSRPASALPAG